MFPIRLEVVTNLVGVTFDGRQSVLAKTAMGEILIAVAEPDNQYDAEAIRIENAAGESLGYISRSFSYKHDLFALLKRQERIITTAFKKRGGGDKNFGMDVCITYIPQI